MEKDSTGALQRAFVEAAKSGNVDALQHLWNDPQFQEHRGILSRTDPISNWNALMWTCEANHLDAVVFLLDIGFEVDVASFDGQTALLRTAANGCLPLVTLLLSRGANINITTDSGDTPLTTAARHGHHDVVQALLEAGAKVDHETTSGNYTALALASKFGHGTVVDLLLQHRASVDLPSFNAFTPLMFASQNGHTACVKSLIDAEANINLQEGANRTALMLATEHGCRQVVSLLLQAGAGVEHACKCLGRFPINPTALVRAAEHGYDTIVGLLLEAGAQLRAHAFAIALEKGHQNVLAELMLVGEDGFDHDDQDDRDEAKLDREDLEVRYPSFERKDDDEGYNTLRLAAGRGDAATVEQLLSTDSNTLQLRLGQEHPLLDGIRSKDLRTVQLLTAASVSKPAANLQRKQSLLDFGGVFGMTPIILSARLGRLDMVKVLLEAGADPNGIDSWKRRTALIEATRQGRYDIAILLLQYGADANAGGQNRTALAHAVGKNDVAMMKLLIAAGAETTPANMKQKRAQPLIIAVKNGSSEALQLLLEAGADPNANDERNNLSPIIIAAKKNNAKVIAMLADAGANVNGTMWNGWSALAFAARDGCLEATKELINRSAYVDAAVSKKYTPVLLAAKNGHTEVARLLLSAGADTDALASDGRSAFDIASLRGFEDICTLLREYGFLSTMGDPVQQQEKTSEVGFGEGHSGTTPLSLYPQDSADKPERSWSDQHTLSTATSGISLGTFGSFLSPADESQRQTERDGQTDLETINSKSGGQSIGSMDSNHTRQALDPSPAVDYDLCDDCMSMIPPIAELKARSSQKDDGNHHKQMLSYDSLSTSAKSGCPGCKMARSFLHRHWSVTELENKPISRSVMVNEKDKKKGFSDFRKLETLHEGGEKGKEFVRDNARMLHFTTRGIGLDGLSPEQLQDKLLQHDVVGDVWDFQTLLVEYQIGKVKGPICRFVVYADESKLSPRLVCVLRG
jgi:ankyrin repeat protein